jgi:hypothetical protein
MVTKWKTKYMPARTHIHATAPTHTNTSCCVTCVRVSCVSLCVCARVRAHARARACTHVYLCVCVSMCVHARARVSVCGYQGFPGGGKKTSPEHKGRAKRPCPPLPALTMHSDDIFFTFVEEHGSVLAVEHQGAQRADIVVAHRVLFHLRVKSSGVIVSVPALLMRFATIDHAKGAVVVICEKFGHVADVIAVENACGEGDPFSGPSSIKKDMRKELRGQQGGRTRTHKARTFHARE